MSTWILINVKWLSTSAVIGQSAHLAFSIVDLSLGFATVQAYKE